MEQVTSNLAGKMRRAKLGGRDHIVVPMTMLVPGVLNGSKGALLYPPEEIGKDLSAWNGMPLTVYHPTDNGQPASARNPSVLDRQSVGQVFHTKQGDSGKLQAEAWFDVTSLQKVDNRVLQALERNQPIELSTGLFTENEPAGEGAEFNGTSYSFIARNYRPDHLAVLPDQKGACSIDDGCGINVNAATKSEDGRPFPARDYAYVPDRNKPSTWKLRLTNVPGGSPDAQIVGAAVAALGKGFRGNRAQIPPESLSAVKSKVKTAWLEANPGRSKDDLPKVLTSNEGGRDMSLTDEQRETVIDGLIANSCCWEEADRETLSVLDEDKLTHLKDQAEKDQKRELVINAARKEFKDSQGSTHTWNEEKDTWETKAKGSDKKPVDNEDAKPPTEEEWLAQAPASVQEDLAFARNEKSKQKAELVEQLVANVEDSAEQNRLSERFMKGSLQDLQDMVKVLPKRKSSPTENWSGAAGGTTTQKIGDNFAPFGLPDEYLEPETVK